MRKLFLILAGILVVWGGSAFAQTTYICSYDKKPLKKILYEIKNNKLYIDQQLIETKSIKVNKLISEYEREIEYDNQLVLDIAKDKVSPYIQTKGIERHKVDLKTGVGFETFNYQETIFGNQDRMIKEKKNGKTTMFITCNGFSIRK